MERGLVFFILVESSVKVFSRKLTLRIKEKNTTPQFALFDLIFILLFPKLGTGSISHLSSTVPAYFSKDHATYTQRVLPKHQST